MKKKYLLYLKGNLIAAYSSQQEAIDHMRYQELEMKTFGWSIEVKQDGDSFTEEHVENLIDLVADTVDRHHSCDFDAYDRMLIELDHSPELYGKLSEHFIRHIIRAVGGICSRLEYEYCKSQMEE